MIPAESADYLADTDVVFGLSVKGDARAYPRRILGWHEMFVDRVGGVPVAGVYCTLCGTMILYRTEAGGSEHQLGTVVDFSTGEIADGIGPHFNRTKAAKWLAANARQFGFRMSYPKGKEAETGYMHEGWHWRYWGDARPPGAGEKAGP